MKKKTLLAIILVSSVVFFSGITYSFFNSNTELNSSNQGIASFIFETENLDKIDLNLNGLKPGDTKEFLFSVTNKKEEKISDVTIEYQLSIKTYHFIPLIINLYKVENNKETFISTCDETSSRNTSNELVCNVPVQTLTNTTEQIDNYILRLSFPIEYNDISYSNLVDYINIEIDSWQKL